jgi:hypothetical protein
MPPIYQPEVAADAVLFAADHPRRREYWVGGSTVGTLLANKIAPGLLDRYLARSGYGAQQTQEEVDTNRQGNLWQPVDGQTGEDFGAHGEFDQTSRPRSLQVWLSQHRAAALTAAAAIAAAALTVANEAIRRR